MTVDDKADHLLATYSPYYIAKRCVRQAEEIKRLRIIAGEISEFIDMDMHKEVEQLSKTYSAYTLAHELCLARKELLIMTKYLNDGLDE